jgi:hypothetical protein
MAKTKIEIEDGASANLKKIGNEAEATDEKVVSLKTQIRKLTQELTSLDPDDARYDEVAKKIGQLKDQMLDAGDAVKSQTGPAFEGMNNTFGIMTNQISNLDFEGLGRSLTSMGANVKKVDFKTLNQEIGGLIKGIANLGKALLSNPIFLIAGAVAGIIAYWSELQALWNSAKIDKLEKAKKVLDDQAVALERQVNIQKKVQGSNADTYDQEMKILVVKKQSAQKEIELASLKGDTEAQTEAIKKKEQAVYDIKLLQAQQQGEINKALDDARRLVDKDYDAQRKKEEASKEFVKAQQNIVKIEEEKIEKGRQNEQLMGSAFKYSKDQTVELHKQSSIQKGNGSMLMAQNQQQEKKTNFVERELTVHEQALANKKSELAVLKEGAKVAQESIKTAEQLKAEADAQARAEERKRKAIEAAQKLKEDIKGIEERISEVLRSQMDDYEKELFNVQKVQEQELKRFNDAKKSEKEIAQLKAVHAFELQLIMDKYDKIEADKAKEKLKKEQEDAQARIIAKQQEIDDLQAIIDKADEENQNAKLSEREQEIRGVQDKYFELKTLAENNKMDTTALVEAERREKQEINDKYDKEELDKKTALEKAKHDAQVQWAEKGLGAIQALGDAVFAHQFNQVQKGSKEEEKLRRKQFNFNKAMQLGGAIIDTAKATIASLASAPVAIGGVPNPAGIASLALVGVTGAASVAKIMATRFESPSPNLSSSGGGSGGGSSSSLPALDTSFLRNRPDQQQAPLHAYVVSSQVSTSLEAQALIKNQSRL